MGKTARRKVRQALVNNPVQQYTCVQYTYTCVCFTHVRTDLPFMKAPVSLAKGQGSRYFSSQRFKVAQKGMFGTTAVGCMGRLWLGGSVVARADGTKDAQCYKWKE